MKGVNFFFRFFAIISFTFYLAVQSQSQIYPVTFEQRVTDANHIVIAKVTQKISYWDEQHLNIYTLNILEVEAYLKGFNTYKTIGLIALGGRVAEKMEISYPSIKLSVGQEILVFLGENNTLVDNKFMRTQRPELLQCLSNFGVQGVLKFQKGKYIDILSETPMSEDELLKRIGKIINVPPRRPDGQFFLARRLDTNFDTSLKAISTINNGAGTSPSSFFSGTIVADNELVISGSGFGAATGSIVFKDANDGGASDFIVPTNTIATDIISWSDTEVRVKIPPAAGTATVEVLDAAGASAGSTSITIDYAISNIISDFYLWGADNRNRLELLDINGAGGYTFEYNNNNPNSGASFFSNIPAREAFERAIESWRCNTFVNFDIDNSGTSAGYAGGNGSIVTFDNLSGGTLAITTSRYSAWGNGGCTMENTLWYIEEIDIRFDNTLPSGFTWNYGPGASTAFANTYDFESVSLHELGHGHGLGHVISSGQVMHYTITNGTDTRVLSASDIAAGVFKVDHSIMANCVSSPSPMIALTGGNCAILPVELVDFNAEQDKGRVRLSWTTASEINNDYFTVERSYDAKNYREIAKVPGAGNSYYLIEYSHFDTKPISGTSYYRLKQTDFDGKSSYSITKSVNIKGLDLSIELYPNPMTGSLLNIQTNSAKMLLTKVGIYDATGRLWHFQNVLQNDKNRNLEVNIGHLPEGVYFVKVETPSGKITGKRFVRQ